MLGYKCTLTDILTKRYKESSTLIELYFNLCVKLFTFHCNIYYIRTTKVCKDNIGQ